MFPWPILILVFIALTFFLALWVFFLSRKRSTFKQKELNYIHSHWVRIIDTFPNNPKEAILDADKLLDYALKVKGFQGTLGDKMKKARFRFSDVNGVWTAHKLRNRIAHELQPINNGEAKSALIQFKRALNDLGANL